MLQTLRIQNFALIDDVELEFSSGFSVLTGETGAGKSIVVGALNLVLGARASSEVLRDKAPSTKIDAIFRIPSPSRRLAQILEEHSVEMEGDELLLSRVISPEGRSRAYAAGRLLTLSVLSEIGDELVDLHGQHEHQSLLKTDRQLDLLDSYAGQSEAVAGVATQVHDLRCVEHELRELQADDRERARRLEFLRFEVDEINKANPTAGEDVALKGKLNLIENAERIYGLASGAYRLLYEDSDGTPALDNIAKALRDVEELARIDERFSPYAKQLESVRAEAEAVALELHGYSEGLDYDEGELDTLKARSVLLSDLRRKFGETIEAVLEYRDRAVKEIDSYENRGQRVAELEAERERIQDNAAAAALALSKKRKKAAKKLDKQVSAALRELGMEGGSFTTRFESAPIGPTGVDRVEFLLSANVGEREKPLRLVASGGEISRIMLALKAVFAEADAIPTLIFDEIDAGVGGAVAIKVSEKLRELSASHQVICVTHLPQIAAAACAHYHIAKYTENGRTATTAKLIEEKSRVDEVARLLDGSLSKVSVEHAKALLDELGAN